MDTVLMDWGYDHNYITDNLRYRPLEVAIRNKNTVIITELGSNYFPSNHQLFGEALRTRDHEIVDLVWSLGCEVPNGTFEDAVIEGDAFSVEYMLKNRILEEEWGLH